MHLKNNLQPTLELESGSNDPMAYVLTIVLIGICTATQSAEGTFETAVVIKDALLTLGQQFLVGILGGVAMGYAAVWVTNKIDLNNPALYAVLMVCVMFFTFSFTGMLGGNGYLAIYLTGIIIGNKPLAKRKHIFAFLDTLTWFMQIAMFLSLGLLVNPTEMLRVWPIGILVGVFMIVLARPLSVFLCLIPFKNIRTKSKHFISWVGLRGAVPIIFATYPVVAGIEGSDIIFNVVFFITLLSLIIQGSTIPFIAEKLDLIGEAPEEENQFGIEVPEDVGQLTEITLTKDSLEHGNTLKELQLPKGMLVVSIKRSGKFLVPNGTRELLPGDRLLIISEAEV
jgi:cell volume regulation protein A